MPQGKRPGSRAQPQPRTFATWRAINRLNTVLAYRVKKKNITKKQRAQILAVVAAYRRRFNGAIPSYEELGRVFHFLTQFPLKKKRKQP